MKTKIILLATALLIVPTMAQAKTHSTHSVGKYRYTYHRTTHYFCPFTGCRKGFTQKP